MYIVHKKDEEIMKGKFGDIIFIVQKKEGRKKEKRKK
jgi:hypothetical protein